MTPAAGAETADAVVVGGGTVGGWCAWALRRAGLERIVVVERLQLGRGASSRAAGVVRTQGGTSWAVRLGMWTRDFYLRQLDEIGTDSGFVVQGYFMPAFTDAQVEQTRARIAMQRDLGLDVSWIDPSTAEEIHPAMAPGSTLGGSYAPGDGYVDPPRNVLAYATALLRSGVEVREGTELLGVRRSSAGRGGVVGVDTSNGTISTPMVVLTGGPELAEVGGRAGIPIAAGAARHQVAVTEPHDAVAPGRIGMVFDLAQGLYWRPEDGGVLFGMSNPEEPPGPAREVDWGYLEKIRERLVELLPATKSLGLRRVWAATIEYTPDHLPILGPALDPDGEPVPGLSVASAGGHGMMYGPAIAHAAADLALHGTTDIVDTAQLGLDRFDAEGNSRLDPDPIALPFPPNPYGERTTTP